MIAVANEILWFEMTSTDNTAAFWPLILSADGDAPCTYEVFVFKWEFEAS